MPWIIRPPGVVQIATVMDRRIKARLNKYAKSRGETIRQVIERAIVREMELSPSVNGAGGEPAAAEPSRRAGGRSRPDPAGG
jgi:hypothetical protein